MLCTGQRQQRGFPFPARGALSLIQANPTVLGLGDSPLLQTWARPGGNAHGLQSACDRTQVWLPAAAKADTREAGAEGKERSLFSGAGHLEEGVLTSQSPSPWEDGGLMSQIPSSWEDGELNLKAHLHLSVEAEVCVSGEKGTEKRSREGVAISLSADEHSPF